MEKQVWVEKIKNAIKKYGFHILIEVLIIVLGVLIALQVNNWNENRQQRKHFKGILKKVLNGWEKDTLIINSYIDRHKLFKDEFNNVIQKKWDAGHLDSCMLCTGLITLYNPIQIENNGMQLLRQYVNYNFQQLDSDSLLVSIAQHHTEFHETISKMDQMIQDEVQTNVQVISQENWFSDLFLTLKTPPEAYSYYLSPTFRNKTTMMRILIEGNTLPVLQQYKKFILTHYPLVEKRMEDL